MTKINNMPNYAVAHNWIVARFVDGEWWFWGAYDDGEDAMDAANSIRGELFRKQDVKF